MQAELEEAPEDALNYLTAAAAPSVYPARKWCSVCGFAATYVALMSCFGCVLGPIEFDANAPVHFIKMCDQTCQHVASTVQLQPRPL